MNSGSNELTFNENKRNNLINILDICSIHNQWFRRTYLSHKQMEQFNTHLEFFYQFINSGSNELTFNENKGKNLIHILDIF